MRTLRVLAILTKRQMIDNAAYLVPAVIFSLVFVPAVVIAVFTDELTAPSLYTVAVFAALPMFLCVGSCALGITQTRADRINRMSELLSTVAAPQAAVLCARVLVGVFVIIVAIVPLMVTGVILWRIVGPPAWLVRGWQADVFSAMFLVAFTSYCLGLSAGMRARTALRGFAVIALAILLVSLIVAKGFGWPLLSILLAILAALIPGSIRPRLPSYLHLGMVGVLATIFVSLGLFWGRFLSDGGLVRPRFDTMEFYPRGLVAQKDNAPRESARCQIRMGWTGWMWENRLLENLHTGRGVLRTLCAPLGASERILRYLGIVEYLQSRQRGNYYVNGGGREGFDFAHLDCVEGQLVYRYQESHSESAAFPWDWERAQVRYIGPDGVSDAPTDKIGRFVASPLGVSEFAVNRFWWSRGLTRHDLNTLALFETRARRFLSIDLDERTVSSGPVLELRPDEPVRTGTLSPREICAIYVDPPRRADGSRAMDFAESPYLPVVRKSGGIELLDRDRLELVGSAGILPRPRTLFGRGSRNPHDLLASDVILVAVGAPQRNLVADRPGRGEYVGAIAASVSRQGTAVSVAVFDRSGRAIEEHDKEAELSRRHLIAKYLFESLHPPILTLASFFTAHSFEAGATHRALFLMPNSFVAQQRDRETSAFFQFCAAMLFLLPALAVAAFLSWRTDRDAASVGLSRRARRWWWLATFAFGVPAYISYRLTRPSVALVFCRSCSQGRRVDQEVCHHCGAGWSVPVREPPAWRVTSEAKPDFSIAR